MRIVALLVALLVALPSCSSSEFERAPEPSDAGSAGSAGSGGSGGSGHDAGVDGAPDGAPDAAADGRDGGCVTPDGPTVNLCDQKCYDACLKSKTQALEDCMRPCMFTCRADVCN